MDGIKRFADNDEVQNLANADIFPIEQMSDETDKKVTFEKLNKQILHNADVECSVDEENATLTVSLKDEEGEAIASDTVELPNTGNLNMEVDEDTAELTVQLKNTKGEVVTEDTVELPNTSNLEMNIDEDNVLTTALKNKSGQTVTEDSVTIPTIKSRNLTWEEYEALPDSKLTDGVYYNIIDRNTMPDSEEIQGNKNFLGSVKVQGEEVVTKNNFILTKEIDYGNVSVTANNYLKLWEGDPNIEIISVILTFWSQNTDVFTLMPYRNNQVYLLMKSGNSITSLRFKVFYIVKE